MNGIRKTVLTLLAALLFLPTFLIAAAASASAQTVTAQSPTAQPGHPPTSCVNDVVRQFNGLKHHPEALGFHLGAGAYDPTSGRHYQGIARLPGEGTPRFITSRNGNPGPFEPLSYAGPGEVNVIALNSRDTDGGRLRSNRMVANTDTDDTPPPAEDAVVKSMKFDGQALPGYPGYMHIGGMQMWGDVAILGMDRPYREPATQPQGEIVMMNFADPMNPTVIGEFPMDHNNSSIGVAEFAPGRLMIVTTGNNGSPVYGFEVMRDGKPTTDLHGDYFHPMGLRPLFTFDAANDPTIGWPTGTDSLQTTNLFTDCNTGEVYLMGGYNLSPFENTSRDRIGLWKIEPTANPPMSRPISKRQVWCEFSYTDRACSMGAASGFYVSPYGDLILYATPHDNDAPDATVALAEFTSENGADQDGSYRPTAVPGTYKAAAGSAITLDGTASRPAPAQARVELFDDLSFKDRSLVVDFPDKGKEDYRHLGRVDGFNDKASSVRWRIPSKCEAVLYDDKDYKGTSRTLGGAQGGPQSLDNLRSMSDKTTSIEFYGDCDGRIVSWSWDLDNDGTVDSTGPKPTIIPKSGGVHQLALTVCSGFGVCNKKVGTLDASAGTPPTSTATVNGTAGTNGWYRSTVNVVVNATGDPTPSEIRYSATGADARNEVVVQGTTATIVVDAQGETVVHYRAVNSSGQEADKTVTVKVDTVAPTLTVRAPVEGGRYTTDTSVTVLADCTDATSGVASCTPNGTSLDTSGTGDRTLHAVATDAAGNTTPKDVHYTLVAPPLVNAELVYVAHGDGSPGPIQRSNADGSNVVQLAARGDDPVWSPDGTRVAYTNGDTGVRQVVVTKADGTGTVVVTDNTTWQASTPAWSPDGSRIVYSGTWVEAPNATDRIIHHSLLTVPATGGPSTVVVASDVVDFLDPTYTRSGAEITFVSADVIRSIPAAGVPAGQLGSVLVSGQGSGEHPVELAWSPDGSTLLFRLWESETFSSDLYAWNGTGNPVNLTGTSTAWPLVESPSAPREEGPAYLADGRIVFVQDGNIWMVPAQRGAQRVLLADFSYAVRDIDAKGA